jgi:hypothetical protein
LPLTPLTTPLLQCLSCVVAQVNFVLYSYKGQEDTMATAQTPVPGHVVTAGQVTKSGAFFTLEHTLKKITFEVSDCHLTSYQTVF